MCTRDCRFYLKQGPLNFGLWFGSGIFIMTCSHKDVMQNSVGILPAYGIVALSFLGVVMFLKIEFFLKW